MRQTRQRLVVLRALREAEGFISVQALHGRLRRHGSRIGLTTIYRTLQELDHEQQLDAVHRPSGERLYQLRAGPRHQHYLVCRECGTSRPLDTGMIESWVAELSRSSGYVDINHTLELDGICAGCRRQPSVGHGDEGSG